jgi:hypothetical protein
VKAGTQSTVFVAAVASTRSDDAAIIHDGQSRKAAPGAALVRGEGRGVMAITQPHEVQLRTASFAG